jgi:hypothetical protein
MKMQIKVSNSQYEIKFELNDSQAARDLAAQLPIKTQVKDYSDDEKIFYPAKKLGTSATPETATHAGDLAYFAPWGDVVMYYRDFGAYPGLYRLGHVVAHQEQIERLTGEITIIRVE